MPTAYPTAEELATDIANDAADHYRFTSVSRVQVARAALAELLRDLVPLVPFLVRSCQSHGTPGGVSYEEHQHLAELLDTMRVKPE